MSVDNISKTLLDIQTVIERELQRPHLDRNEESSKIDLEKISEEIVSIFLDRQTFQPIDSKETTLDLLAQKYIERYPELKSSIVQLFPEMKIPKITQLFAKCNVGWGASLGIRGNGPNLDWNVDGTMSCTGSNSWNWETTTDFKAPFEYKLVWRNNDTKELIWEQRDSNRTMHSNSKEMIIPIFPHLAHEESNVFLTSDRLNQIYFSQYTIDKLKSSFKLIDQIATRSVALRNNPKKETLKMNEKKTLVHNTAQEIVLRIEPTTVFQTENNDLPIEELRNAYIAKYPFLAPFFNQVHFPSQELPKEEMAPVVESEPTPLKIDNGIVNLKEQDFVSQKITISPPINNNEIIKFEYFKFDQKIELKSKRDILRKVGDVIEQFGKKIRTKVVPSVVHRGVQYSNGVRLEVIAGNMFQDKNIHFRGVAGSRDHRAQPGGQAAGALAAMGAIGRDDYFSKVEDFFLEHRMLQDREMGYRAQGSGMTRSFPETPENLVPLMEIGKDVLISSGGDAGGEFLWVNGPNLSNPQNVAVKKLGEKRIDEPHIEQRQIREAARYLILTAVQRAHELNINGPVNVALPLISANIYGYEPKESLPHVFTELKQLVPNLFGGLKKEFCFKFYELPDNKNLPELIKAFDNAYMLQ
ncbi:MAG: CBM20 domain-containing protein [Rhabdochlamydiaceae bacterium]|jgi:hypothetical protein